MNQPSRATGELAGPITTTATVIDTVGGDGPELVPAVYRGPNSTASSGPSPLGLLKALRRRLMLAVGLGTLVSAACASAAWSLLPPPNYQAQAKVLVRTSTPQIMWKTVDAEAERDESIRSQKSQLIQLKSRFVINTALQQRGISDLNMIRELIRQQERPVEWLSEHLQAQFLTGTEVLQISLDGQDPAELAQVVNAVTNTYIEEVANGDQKRRIQRRELLKRLSKEKFDLLKNRREALRQLAKRAGSDDRETLVLKQQYAIELGTDVRKDLREVQSQKRKLEAMVRARQPDAVQETAAPTFSNDDVARLVEQDPEVLDLRSRIDAATERLASEAAYTGRVARNATLNPALKTLRDRVDLLKKQLERKRKSIRPIVIKQLQNPPDEAQAIPGAGGSPEQQLAVLKELEASLQEELKNASNMDQVLTDNTLDVQDNKEELKQVEDAATKISMEVEKLDVELQAPPRISLLEEAIPPTTRNTKKWYMTFGMIAIGSFFGCLFLVAFLEMQSHRIDSADEVIADLGLTVVGSLPMLPATARRNRGMVRSEKDSHWYNLLLESIDATRTMLIHAARSGGHRVVMIASALPGEGKTSLASHLATSLARSGQRTLLVDADLRCPTIHGLFDLPPEPGLSELLRGQATLEDVVSATAVEELKVIPGGRCDAQTLRILSQGGMGGLFGQLKEHFDFVIVDSSPILPVADALIMAQQVDAVLFSVLADVSRKKQVLAAYQRITSLGIKVLGAVLTGVSDRTNYGRKYYTAYSASGRLASPERPGTTTISDDAS